MKRYLIVCLLSLAAFLAQAGVGLTELPGLDGDGPVTVFYPSSAPDQPLQRGPYALQLAPGGAPMRGNGRLVVMSHGSGGAPWVHSDLAKKLVDAGFVVAFPEHLGDNFRSMRDAGPVSWRTRASGRWSSRTGSACTACPPAATRRSPWQAVAGRPQRCASTARSTSRKTFRAASAWRRNFAATFSMA